MITIGTEPSNDLRPVLRHEITHPHDEVAGDDGLRSVVMDGQGTVFRAGANLQKAARGFLEKRPTGFTRR